MRVLSVTSTYPRWPGDATTAFVHHVAVDLRARGVDVEVLAPHAVGAATDDELDGVRVHRYRYARPARAQTLTYSGGALVNLRRTPWVAGLVPPLLAGLAGALRRRLARGDVDVVHSHWCVPQGFVASAVARRLGVPHVATVHGGDVFSLRARPLERAKRYALTHADAITVNSAATGAEVARLAPGAGPVHRIPMGVDTTQPDDAEVAALRAAHGGGPLVVFVGRLVAEKGVGDLLEAVALARRERPGLRLLLAGAGPEAERFAARAAQPDLAGAVDLLGWVAPARIPAVMAAGDVVAVPTRGAPDGWVEAQGLTAAEALAVRRPVVAARVGGLPETVRHEETGLLVEPKDPRALAAALLRLVDDPALAARLGDAGRRLVDAELTREECARRLHAVMDEVVERRVAARRAA